MRSILVGLGLVLVSCNAQPSSAAGAIGAPKGKGQTMPMLEQKALEQKAALDVSTKIVAPDMVQKIVAPDMVQKIVAPDMIQSGQKIVAPDMVQKIVAPDMVQKPSITPPGPGPKPLSPPPVQ
jgi:hypothetical protein